LTFYDAIDPDTIELLLAAADGEIVLTVQITLVSIYTASFDFKTHFMLMLCEQINLYAIIMIPNLKFCPFVYPKE
jgi:hypothetical protein